MLMKTTTIKAVITGHTDELELAKVTAIRHPSKSRLFSNVLELEWDLETPSYDEALQTVMDECIDPTELEKLYVKLDYLG